MNKKRESLSTRWLGGLPDYSSVDKILDPIIRRTLKQAATDNLARNQELNQRSLPPSLFSLSTQF